MSPTVSGSMGDAPPTGNSVTAAGTLDERLSALLSSSNFSVSSYLNLALADASNASSTPVVSGAPDELQRRMAELALQLQLQTQSCHEDIGKIGAELQAILPRCAADVGRVGVGLEGMRIDAASLLETTALSNDQEHVSSSLETLSTLHALQANLSRTKEVLTAAATWDTTLSSVSPLLAQQNLTEAVQALAKLESGERALRGMPHPEERQASIAKIRQQVQTLLQPQLKHALQNMNTRLAPLQQCVSLYTKLGKMQALQEEYVKNRPAAIHKAWFSYTPSYEKTNDAAQPDPAPTADAFVTWLPSWYESVLSLLSEERRQSLAIFGPERASDMTVKVLAECFRPILPSFKSRLESIYASDPSGPSTKGSFESICSLFESSLQFMSLAYESVAGGFLDVVEAGTAKSDGLELYKDMMAVFVRIASPFSAHQDLFAQLESKHSGIVTQTVLKEIQHTVRSVSSGSASLNSLQDATDRLKDLAPYIFPLAEGSLVRFELLNGGYRATNALATMDTLLSGHAGELAIAIRTLSAALTADKEQLADNFDEQHVQCALEVLKVAGSFRRHLTAFEAKTRERLGVLCERIADQMARERELEEASSTAAGSTSTFLMPDSLSVVRIASVLAKAVCHDSNEGTTASFSVLQRLAQAEGAAVALFSDSDKATQRLANSCHMFVFDVCSAVPRRYLYGMSTMSAWKEEAGTDDFESYGTLPQQYVTQVGEHMLALVQALEPFASDAKALALANETMEGARDVAVQPWREFVAATGSMESDFVVQTLMQGKEIREHVIGDAMLDEEDSEDDHDEEQDEASKASTAFCNAWLDVVGTAVTGRLLERIMRIPQLTPKGCEHISADLNYLVNVFSALGVAGHPHPLLSHVAELAMLGNDELKEQIASRDRSNPVVAALRSVEVRVALMRGVAVS